MSLYFIPLIAAAAAAIGAIGYGIIKRKKSGGKNNGGGFQSDDKGTDSTNTSNTRF